MSLWHEMLNVLADSSVSEITTNGPKELFYKRDGKRLSFDFCYDSVEAYEDDIENVLAKLVRSRFKYGMFALFEGPIETMVGDAMVYARCHIVLPPGCDTPQVTIAKRSMDLTTLDDMVSTRSITVEVKRFLENAVKARLGIVFSGQTGAGKSTMLSACCKHVSSNLRIGVAEDSPELLLSQPNVSYLHSTPNTPGLDSKDIIPLSWCVSQFKRMRVDSIIVGETRGSEFYDYLIAANSGSQGCMTTLHANDAYRAIQTMKGFATIGSGRDDNSVCQQIANAVDVIVQLGFNSNGQYRVLEILEVTNTVNSENGLISTSLLFEYDNSRDCLVRKNVMSSAMRDRFDSCGLDYSFMYDNMANSSFNGYNSFFE